MFVTKEVFNRMLPGDFVKVKTIGQLIDTGWVERDGVYVHENCWAGVIPDAMKSHLGQLCRIKEFKRHPVTQEVFVILEEDEHEFCYTIEMMHELYPLTRGMS